MSAIDKESKEEVTEENPDANKVAMKKIERAFEHELFSKRTLRELKILRLLDHENVRSPQFMI